MPRIFDNIEIALLGELRQTLGEATHADFCVGYFNLRGWKPMAPLVDDWAGGDGACVRLLVGMQNLPQEELRAFLSLQSNGALPDQQTIVRLKKRMAQEFREQLLVGAPTNADEAALQRLKHQLRNRQVVAKLFLKHHLHAKLYLVHRPDLITPIVGYLGSSNLTLSGLSKQGELNVDVTDQDACHKLQRWFDDRWCDNRCLDITDELAGIIDESWAREELIPPYHLYLKIAYHLSQEARAGLADFRIPRDFGDRLFEYQVAAVKIAAHHLNKRGGVVIGDVVGLGKTLMATALARIFEDDQGTETLIICPKNLVRMWEDYQHRYRLRARVVSLTSVENLLPFGKDFPRFRVVLIDESHNLRNPEGKRYKVIQDYIDRNGSKCILLSATPYNKAFLDLSAQLKLFVDPEEDIGVRPERLIKEDGEAAFLGKFQGNPRSLAAFERSEFPDDWRDLLRRYLVRRTRGFIQDNYALTAEDGRKYLKLEDGGRSYFPTRVPKNATFPVEETNPSDQYARLFAPAVEDAVNALRLPRYGLGNYLAANPDPRPTATERDQLQNLSRAGVRLMGFSRTNLFKRLESGGPAFIKSVERHILRNFVYLHAIERGLAIPLGTQEADLLDSAFTDADHFLTTVEPDDAPDAEDAEIARFRTEAEYLRDAEAIYAQFTGPLKRNFKWLPPHLLTGALAADLRYDANLLLGILKRCGPWNPAADAKLAALGALITERHPDEKVLVFTQFADTVDYLTRQLKDRGVTAIEGATGDAADPTALAWRFSPRSNDREAFARQHGELRVLVATDVLSEGQNLQDCAIVVNFDLPWAIIRLIQRAGRVDRIGQQATEILCYSFLPAEGIERIIKLRRRVRQRLKENAEVVGADEAFFEDETEDQQVLDLYNEKAGILDGDADTEVDLASYAYQIWKNATDANPALAKLIPALPDVAYATRAHTPTPDRPHGVLVYLRTADENDALAWIDHDGNIVSESQFNILRAAECPPDTPAHPRHERHHELVEAGVKRIVEEVRPVGGQLGPRSGARYRTYERLKQYAAELARPGMLPLWAPDPAALNPAIDDIYRYRLWDAAKERLNRLLRTGASDEAIARAVIDVRAEDRLCQVTDAETSQEPRIICSMGLVGAGDQT